MSGCSLNYYSIKPKPNTKNGTASSLLNLKNKPAIPAGQLIILKTPPSGGRGVFVMRNQIEAIVQTLNGNPQFAYGTQAELNVIADDVSFPCVFLYPLPPIELSPQINGSVDNTFTLYIEFLFKTDFGQFTADNETYIAQALQLANEFIVKASGYREGEGRYFKVKAGQKAKCVPVYNKLDVNTSGIGLTITLSTMYFDRF